MQFPAKNNLELHLGCHTCTHVELYHARFRRCLEWAAYVLNELFYIGMPVVQRDGQSVVWCMVM